MDAQQIQGILGLGLSSGGTSGSGWFRYIRFDAFCNYVLSDFADASFVSKL